MSQPDAAPSRWSRPEWWDGVAPGWHVTTHDPEKDPTQVYFYGYVLHRWIDTGSGLEMLRIVHNQRARLATEEIELDSVTHADPGTKFGREGMARVGVTHLAHAIPKRTSSWNRDSIKVVDLMHFLLHADSSI